VEVIGQFVGLDADIGRLGFIDSAVEVLGRAVAQRFGEVGLQGGEVGLPEGAAGRILIARAGPKSAALKRIALAMKTRYKKKGKN